MKSLAFKMKLKPEMAAEYKRRHDEFWPGLTALLKANGILDYNIFFDPDTGILFATLKQNVSPEEQDLKDSPLMRKWWEYMADIMETNPDKSPVMQPLQELFHMD